MKKISKFKEDRSGFSLIELIIVIAIMAILVALLAPQYLRYVEKSKQGKDYEVAGVVQHAITVAMSDTSINDRPQTFGPAPIGQLESSTGMTDFVSAVKEYIGTNNLGTFKTDNIKSNAYRNADMMIEIDADQELVRVTVSSNSANVDDIKIE